MSVVISVENVSKLYRLGEIGTGSLSHDINRWWHTVRGKEDPYLKIGQSNDRTSKGEFDYVYALKDVSFEAKQGEVLGIIGRNGAGKSTLLKILSRVTTPTTGEIKAKGRIASLLEVGTGFHPELSGRDNIYLNGAILGMRKNEIASKFDEIVEFSGCERYIDTPVKRYSSGMYVRLAFAVAAHLEPEILIIDEVLAVGDAEFQKKCLGKMKDVAGEGRTVLFVSHTMSAVSSLCSRCLLMENGQIASSGTPSEIIPFYFRMGKESPSSVDFTKGQSISGEGATLLSAQITDDQGMPLAEALITKPIQIRMRYRIDADQKSPHYPNFHIFDGTGNCAFVAFADASGLPTKTGEYEAICHIPARFLNDGTYSVGIALTIAGTVRVAFYEREALHLHVKDPLEETLDTLRNGYAGPVPGVVRPYFEWNIIKIS